LKTAGHARNRGAGIPFDIAFPDYDGEPSCLFELGDIVFIPQYICLEFLVPELASGFRRIGIFTPWMPMPEAAVDEDYGPILG
jgi:hypothetical protein